jgi:5'-3' exonuclease
MNRMMIVDGNNSFLRNYVVDPSLSNNGEPIGGCKGFLKSLQKQCRIIKPDFVVVVWDGEGGSLKRRTQNKNYKEGRKPIRFNRPNTFMTDRQQNDNRVWQMGRLFEYLNELPIAQLISENVEADDLVGYIVSRFPKTEKVIVSSDKDFFQLCDDKTIVYRPIQDKFVTKKTILEEFKIHPRNFALARAITGDKSDNLVGVPRAGLKTVASRFPEMAEDRDIFINELVQLCETAEKKVKIYESIVENKQLVTDNYKLMQLYTPSISTRTKAKIDWSLKECCTDFNLTQVNAMMLEDGFGNYNFGQLWATMRNISLQSK